jgi:hypothetical protein
MFFLSVDVLLGIRRTSKRTWDKIFCLSPLAVNAALQSFQKERSLGFGVREFKRFPELFGGDLQIARAHFEFALYSIE